MSYDNVTNQYKAYLSEFSIKTKLRTYEEAIKDNRWIHSMQQEIKALLENGTWKIVYLPIGKRVIDCK